MLLAARRRSFAALGLKVQICPSEQVVERLLTGKINFGFVTKHFEHSALLHVPFCVEEYVLIGCNERKIETIDRNSLTRQRFIHHPGVEIFFQRWRQTNLPRARNLSWADLPVIGEINGLKGVIDMIRQDVEV